jgi:hypothetical protein
MNLGLCSAVMSSIKVFNYSVVLLRRLQAAMKEDKGE